MSEAAFDVIPYTDIKGSWKKLGSGSFGNVYKGSYLGIDIAIKEVLPSTDYDVGKYFEREYRLMKEARHPNVVLYLGLSRSPDGRIFIISEFVEGGNLRTYIYDKLKPFPWPLRISFAIDICRALAYLHARKCIHRDLKGENLLITSNLRIKITDFGFARIAARNDLESKRLTFCGTDAYMSPEIQTGTPFDLPTDIYSLGIILAEIAARRLADATHFARAGPTFSINPDEVRRRVSPGCPESFIDLILSCLKDNPSERPLVTDILDRLQVIEAEVIARPENKDTHIGSIRFLSKGRRPGQAPRIPSFKFHTNKETSIKGTGDDTDGDGHDTEEDELAEAVLGLADVGLESDSEIRPEDTYSNLSFDDSATVIKAGTKASSSLVPSNITLRPQDSYDSLEFITSDGASSADSYYSALGSQTSIETIRSDNTNTSHITSSQPPPPPPTPRLHRFTLIKPGAKRLPATSIGNGNEFSAKPETSKSSSSVPWSPFHLLFSSGLLVARCDICGQRLGWKSSLECDDCGLKTHLKCSDIAPCNCGVGTMSG